MGAEQTLEREVDDEEEKKERQRPEPPPDIKESDVPGLAEVAAVPDKNLPDQKSAEDEEQLDAIKTAVAEDAEGLRIFIGSESKLFSLSGSSTIVAPYRDGAGRVVGVLGVIGPTRLNYARVIPMVDYTAKVVSRVLGLQSDA